jgi:hypothetical protein
LTQPEEDPLGEIIVEVPFPLSDQGSAPAAKKAPKKGGVKSLKDILERK